MGEPPSANVTIALLAIQSTRRRLVWAASCPTSGNLSHNKFRPNAAVCRAYTTPPTVVLCVRRHRAPAHTCGHAQPGQSARLSNAAGPPVAWTACTLIKNAGRISGSQCRYTIFSNADARTPRDHKQFETGWSACLHSRTVHFHTAHAVSHTHTLNIQLECTHVAHAPGLPSNTSRHQLCSLPIGHQHVLATV
jgi:hypothetical protein